MQPSDDVETVFYHGGSCNRCKGTGFKDRIGIFELMVMSEALRDLLLRGASASEVQAQAVTEGMRPMLEDGVVKVLEGQTAADELFRVVLVEDGKRAPGSAAMDTSDPELR